MRTLLALALVLLPGSPAAAIGFAYTDSLRSVHALFADSESSSAAGTWSASIEGVGFEIPDPDEGPEFTFTNASQGSYLGSKRITFAGSVGGGTDDGPGPGASSSLVASFTLDTARRFTANGSFEGDIETGGSSVYDATIDVSLVGPGGVVFQIFESDDSVSAILAEEGVLLPGAYTLTISIAGRDRHGLGGDGEFTLLTQAIPEPGTALLVGAGLAGLARAGRRHLPRRQRPTRPATGG